MELPHCVNYDRRLPIFPKRVSEIEVIVPENAS